MNYVRSNNNRNVKSFTIRLQRYMNDFETKTQYLFRFLKISFITVDVWNLIQINRKQEIVKLGTAS